MLLIWSESIAPCLINLFKLRNIVPIETIRNIYFAFYQPILQYRFLAWEGIKDNYSKILQSDQNNKLRIILLKKTLESSTKLNYMYIGVLPVRYLYEKIALMFIIKKKYNPKTESS